MIDINSPEIQDWIRRQVENAPPLSEDRLRRMIMISKGADDD